MAERMVGERKERTEESLGAFLEGDLFAGVDEGFVLDFLARGHHHPAADRVEGVCEPRRALNAFVSMNSSEEKK